METFALVKLEECPAGRLIMPRPVSIALFHGGKDMDQPFGLFGFLDDFLDSVIFAEDPKLTDKLDFNAVFISYMLGDVPRGYVVFGITSLSYTLFDPNAFG